jgi:hypothetical protein
VMFVPVGKGWRLMLVCSVSHSGLCELLNCHLSSRIEARQNDAGTLALRLVDLWSFPFAAAVACTHLN